MTVSGAPLNRGRPITIVPKVKGEPMAHFAGLFGPMTRTAMACLCLTMLAACNKGMEEPVGTWSVTPPTLASAPALQSPRIQVGEIRLNAPAAGSIVHIEATRNNYGVVTRFDYDLAKDLEPSVRPLIDSVFELVPDSGRIAEVTASIRYANWLGRRDGLCGQRWYVVGILSLAMSVREGEDVLFEKTYNGGGEDESCTFMWQFPTESVMNSALQQAMQKLAEELREDPVRLTSPAAQT